MLWYPPGGTAADRSTLGRYLVVEERAIEQKRLICKLAGDERLNQQNSYQPEKPARKTRLAPADEGVRLLPMNPTQKQFSPNRAASKANPCQFWTDASLALATVLLFPNPALCGTVANEASIADSAPVPVALAKPRAGNIDALTLIGTASSPTGDYAFFDSNLAQFRILVRRGERIANFVVESITPDRVHLKHGAQEIVLPITRQLQRAEQGPWQLATANDRIQWPDGFPAPDQASAPKAVAATSAPLMAGKGAVPTAMPAMSDKQLRKLDRDAGETTKPPKASKGLVRAAESKFIKTLRKEFKRGK